MAIHTVIQERRRALGLTQEQVAEYLGVTTSAVNKWEKGSTCPDIAILSPLARLLKVDLNTLLGFYEDITQQELILFCREIREVVHSEGFKAGFAAAQERLCEYPNSDTLLHNFALLLQGLLTTARLDEETTKAYMGKIETWYERLASSDETFIRNSACFMLASRAINDGQYDKAQEYLDQMPNRNDTPDKRMLQASIYLNQGQAVDAAKLLEQMLLTAVNDVQTIMYKLMEANIALGEQDTAVYVADRIAQLAETFDLNQYNTVAAHFQIAMANKDTKQTVALLRKMLESMEQAWRVQESPLYRRVATNGTGTSMVEMICPLLEELKQSPEYAYLQEDKDFQSMVIEFKEKYSHRVWNTK